MHVHIHLQRCKKTFAVRYSPVDNACSHWRHTSARSSLNAFTNPVLKLPAASVPGFEATVLSDLLEPATSRLIHIIFIFFPLKPVSKHESSPNIEARFPESVTLPVLRSTADAGLQYQKRPNLRAADKNLYVHDRRKVAYPSGIVQPERSALSLDADASNLTKVGVFTRAIDVPRAEIQ